MCANFFNLYFFLIYIRYIYKLCPIGILYGFDIIFTTIGITYGPYAFVEMIKSGIPTVVLIFTCLSNNTDEGKIDFLRIISIIIITLGQICIYFTEVDFSWISFIFSLLALFTSSLKLIVIERLVSGHRFKRKKNRNRNRNRNTNDNHGLTDVGSNSYQNSGSNNDRESRELNKDDSDSEEDESLGNAIQFAAGDIAMLPVSSDILVNDNDPNLEDMHNENGMNGLMDDNNDSYDSDSDDDMNINNINNINNNNNNINGQRKDYSKLELGSHSASKSISKSKNKRDFRSPSSQLDLKIDMKSNSGGKSKSASRSPSGSGSGSGLHRGNHPPPPERIHSVLALFYFMPIAFILSFILFLVCFNVFKFYNNKSKNLTVQLFLFFFCFFFSF